MPIEKHLFSTVQVDAQYIFFAWRKDIGYVKRELQWQIYNQERNHRKWRPYGIIQNGSTSSTDSSVGQAAYRDLDKKVWSFCLKTLLGKFDHREDVVIYDPWACSPSLPCACFLTSHADKPSFRYIGDLRYCAPMGSDASTIMSTAGKLKIDTFHAVLDIKKVTSLSEFLLSTAFFILSFTFL